MSDIRQLVTPGESGWRVAVATAFYPDGAAEVVIRPLVGWAQVADPEVGLMWLPAWWDELGLTTGSPQEIARPLGPGEDLSHDHAEYLRQEATASYRMSVHRARSDQR